MTLPDSIHPDEIKRRVELANDFIREAYAVLPWKDPVGCVQWVPLEMVQANDYNPNAVAHQEMRLLYVSIEQDGYTQPIVCVWDSDARAGRGGYVIVDGFHRWTIERNYALVRERLHGYVPIVIIDKPPADRMASTIRHNRARGKHSVQGMGNLVFEMLAEGVEDTEICDKLGLEPTELARLKHITGYSKLYAGAEYQRPLLSESQMKAKAKYAREHPDEVVPTHF